MRTRNNFYCQIAQDSWWKDDCKTQCDMCKNNPQEIIKKAKKDKNKKSIQRYYLHSKIKKEGYKFSAIKRTIYIPYNNTIKLSKSVIKLQNEFNYSIQTEIV